ncbi:MAG: hypothetical protein VX938_06200, partial [Myxococcota bacterium]|nr:hypothetical protein [Myxococcota bacterium]
MRTWSHIWMLSLTLSLVAGAAGCSDTDDASPSPSGDVESDAAGSTPDVSANPDGVGITQTCEGLDEGAVCDDGDACTEGETCLAGLCSGGVTVTCDPGSPCRPGSCDGTLGCIYTDEPDGAPCETGCYDVATCSEGECVVDPTSAVVCPSPADPCIAQLGCDTSTGECSI